jgi:hypothetical protein
MKGVFLSKEYLLFFFFISFCKKKIEKIDKKNRPASIW